MSRHNQRWTDEEISLVLAPELTAAEKGEILGRSESAVWNIAYRIRKGWTPELAPWTASEEEYLAANAHLTAERVAEDLSRTYGAVKAKRRTVAASQGVNFQFNKSPFDAGRRRVLAKTCIACGLLLDGKFFADGGYYAARCGNCRREANPIVRHGWAVDIARMEEDAARLAPPGTPYKSRHASEWNDHDLAVLSDPDLTAIEKAAALGRTVAAVHSAMSRFGYTVNRSLGNPDDGVWHIRFPIAM